MTWLETQVRNAKLAQVAICVGVIVAVGAGLGVFHRYLQSYLAGPYDIPEAELTAAASADALDRYWVRFKPRQLVDTKVDHITVNRRRGVETGRSVTGHYWVAVVGDRLLFVMGKSSTDLRDGEPLLGAIVATPQNVHDHLMRGVQPAWQHKVLPFMLDTARFETTAEIGLVGAAGVTTLALLWAGVTMIGALYPRRHAALRRLTDSGIGLEDASRLIQEDKLARREVRLGRYSLSRGFLVKTGLAFDARPTRDLVWAYTITTTHKMYGLITTGRSYQLAMHLADGHVVTEKVSLIAAERALPALSQAAPWVLLGHSPEIQGAWDRNRTELARLVAERHAQVLAHWATQAAPGNAAPPAPTGHAQPNDPSQPAPEPPRAA